MWTPIKQGFRSFSKLTHQSMTFMLLNSAQMSVIIGILAFTSRINDWFWPGLIGFGK